MWIHAQRAQPILKKLLPELSNATTTLELSSVINQIYEKHFRDKVNIGKDESPKSSFHLNAKTNITTAAPPAPSGDDVWIFGYGSLVWKADFPYIDRCRGYINGYQRRFFQHSIDHRGTPTKPGRVVTLLPGLSTDRVYGVAYRISATHKENVLQHLDYREKNGYERCELVFQEFPDTQNKQHINIIMYVACHSNDSYAGEVWQIPRIAEQIFTSAGPSGPNRDYLFNLADAMRELFPGVQDTHLFELEKEVKHLIETIEASTLESALKKQIENLLVEITSHSEATALTEEKVEYLFDGLCSACNKSGWRERLLTQELQSTSSAATPASTTPVPSTHS